jgi:hypothetical protein
MEEIARSGQRYPTGENTGNYPNNYPNNPPQGRVQYPSTRYQSVDTLGGLVRLSVPNNWQQVSESNNSVWFSPQGGYGNFQNQNVFTHGVNVGIFNSQSRNLQQATNEFINSLAQGNGNIRQSGGYQRVTVSGRTGLSTRLANINEATGQSEIVTVVTTQLRNGDLFYMIAVTPQNDAGTFQSAFSNILRSIQLND